MIVYLGLPRCASTWIYSHLNTEELKESHYLYTSPRDPISYIKNKQFEFSTNNWSMDSNVARAIDPYVDTYILTVRNPIDLAVSYKNCFNVDQPLEQFIKTLIINKLLCYGDIIERWYTLVDPAKILICNYDDILADNQKFIIDLANKLETQVPATVNFNKINVSVDKVYEPLNSDVLDTLKFQIEKFEKITNLTLNYAINN